MALDFLVQATLPLISADSKHQLHDSQTAELKASRQN